MCTYQCCFGSIKSSSQYISHTCIHMHIIPEKCNPDWEKASSHSNVQINKGKGSNVTVQRGYSKVGKRGY